MSSLFELVMAVAADAGERPAIIGPTGTVSYRDLARIATEGTEPIVVTDDPAAVAAAVVAASRVNARLLLLDVTSTAWEQDWLIRRSDATQARGLALSTSGTEGRPKCVIRPWEAVLGNALAFGAALGLESGDVVVSTTPPHHSYAVCGGIITALAAGTTFVGTGRRAGPRVIVEALTRYRPRILMSVPLLFRWYAQAPKPLAGAGPRLCLSAGSPLPDADRVLWSERVGWPLGEHYGSSELGMLTVDTEQVPGSVGRPLSGVEIAAGTPDAPGQVLVRVAGPSPVVVHGGTAGTPGIEVVELAGWHDTGDLGWSDVDGRLWLTGRTGSIINVGGNKVAASEVEAAIRDFPAVTDCAVVAEPAADGSARIWAFVETDVAAFDVAGLSAFLRTRLAAHKVPRVIRAVKALPRGGAGKIRRADLLGEFNTDVG